jgi:hypothetical protein
MNNSYSQLSFKFGSTTSSKPMGNIIDVTLCIEGIRPLLFHHFGNHAIPLEKQERSGVPGNDPDEWRESYLATPEGQLYLPEGEPYAPGDDCECVEGWRYSSKLERVGVGRLS